MNRMNVFLQFSSIRKWFTTWFTFVIFVTFMNCLDVFLQVLCLSKWFATWFTLVIFVAFMNCVLGMGRASESRAPSEYEYWNPELERVQASALILIGENNLFLCFWCCNFHILDTLMLAEYSPSINPEHEWVWACSWTPKTWARALLKTPSTKRASCEHVLGPIPSM